MAGKLIVVPNREVRSTAQNDKGQKFVTIHTGRFEVVADVTDEGRIRITRETLEGVFDVIEPDDGAAEETEEKEALRSRM